MNLLWLNDGKAGHRRQAEGLLAGLVRCGVALQVREMVVPLGLRDWPRMQSELLNTIDPELLLGVGHRTHVLLLLLKRRYPRAQTVVLMRPSLPLSWFDHLIMPQHDQPPSVDRIFVSQGALNPIINQQRHQVGRHLILLGGASKRHGWDQRQVLAQLTQLTEYLHGQSVWISSSRRTPADFLSSTDFQNITATMQHLPCSQTDSALLSGLLDEQLQLAATVWVTEDSVSMISEAWTAGCRVGLIAMPRIKIDRITRAVDRLIERQVVLPLADYLAGQALRVPPRLVESDRAAGWLLLQLRQRLNGQ